MATTEATSSFSWGFLEPGRGTQKRVEDTVDGRNPFRTTLKQWETHICWHLQGNRHPKLCWVVQDFVFPQFVAGAKGGGYGHGHGSQNLWLHFGVDEHPDSHLF